MWHAQEKGNVFTGFWFGGPQERARRRWKDNTKMDLREMGIHGANWSRLAQERVRWRAFVNTVTNLQFPLKSRLFFDKMNYYQLFKEHPAP
jgi:hypothetical protein